MAECRICGRRVGTTTITKLSSFGLENGGDCCSICAGMLRKVGNNESAANEYFRRILQTAEDPEIERFIKSKLDDAVRPIREAEEAKRVQEEAIEQEKVDSILIATTESISGYIIDSVAGIVTGEAVYYSGAGSFLDQFPTARDEALDRLKKSAVKAGANAVVGVSFNCATLTQDQLAVVASGTAVTLSR